MGTLPYSSRARIIPDLPLIVLAGSGSALALFFGMALGGKWSLVILLCLAFMAGIMVIPRREEFLLALTVLLLPIGLDFHPLYFADLSRSTPIYGFKLVAIDLPFFLLLGAWLFRLVTGRQAGPRLYPRITIPFLLIFSLSWAGMARSSMPEVYLFSSLWLTAKHGLFFLYAANNLRERKKIVLVLVLLLASGVIQSLLGLAQHLSGGTLGLEIFGEAEKSYFVMKTGRETVSRVAGTLGHPNKLAVYLGMLLQVNIALFFAPLKQRQRVLLTLSFLLMSATMLLTYSRGGWLGSTLAATLTLYWCLARTTRRRILSAICMAIFVLWACAATIGLVSSVRSRLFTSDYGTAMTRVPLAQVALKMIQDNPWLGVGLTNYTLIFHRYDTTAEAITYTFPAPVHNEFLLIGAEQGLPALVLFLGLFVVILHLLVRTATKRGDPLIPFVAIGFFGAWIGWIIHHLFEYQYSFLLPELWLLFGLIQAMHDQMQRLPPPTAALKPCPA